MLDITLTDNFQYHFPFIDTDNITGQDQRKNDQITDKVIYDNIEV